MHVQVKCTNHCKIKLSKYSWYVSWSTDQRYVSSMYHNKDVFESTAAFVKYLSVIGQLFYSTWQRDIYILTQYSNVYTYFIVISLHSDTVFISLSKYRYCYHYGRGFNFLISRWVDWNYVNTYITFSYYMRILILYIICIWTCWFYMFTLCT